VFKPMSYKDFLLSLEQDRLHFVSGRSIQIKGLGLMKEPAYLLESSGSLNAKAYIHNLSSIQGACTSFFKTFKMTGDDKWGVCLSTSHVAGFSILARSHFGGLQEPHFFNWSADSLCTTVDEYKISILSLVPTQIFDLVKKSFKPPSCLRMVFVGGAKLSKDLRDEAARLGWPLVDCYGSTETFAQMSYSLDGTSLKPFEGWSVRTEKSEIIVRGPGLFVAEVREGLYRSRKTDWFRTGDIGDFENGHLQVFGKKGGLVKIKGSYFDFNKFKADFTSYLIENNIDPKNHFVVCLKEDRDGAGLYLISKFPQHSSQFFQSFTNLRGVFYLKEVDRSSLGKVQASKLSDVLKKTVLCL